MAITYSPDGEREKPGEEAAVGSTPAPSRMERAVSWGVVAFMTFWAVTMTVDRQRALSEQRDLEQRLSNAIAGYEKQRGAGRELYAARLEIERLKAELARHEGRAIGLVDP